MAAHNLPRHPLVEDGYPSIGCMPCTRRVQAGESYRDGRWSGLDKDECGIHVGVDGRRHLADLPLPLAGEVEFCAAKFGEGRVRSVECPCPRLENPRRKDCFPSPSGFAKPPRLPVNLPDVRSWRNW